MIYFTTIKTPIGNMIACANEQGICLLEFEDRKELSDELKLLPSLFQTSLEEGMTPILEQLKIELDEYFAGQRNEFSVPLLFKGTPFQQAVWHALRNIPAGQTRTYKEQAMILGKPEAIRAVGTANGRNKIAILVPCHRVIGSNGALTGYAGGLWRKEYLLKLESTFKTLKK